MTIEEAIKQLQNDKEIIDEHSGYYGTAEHIDMAIEALEKQMPKKPIMREWCPAYCPACKAELSESKGDGYYKHYYNLKICDCGQKLKWE